MNLYDEVAYRGSAVPQTHPDRLATLATLFGMKPAVVESCRVLEVGCGDGHNLIPMAYALPGSRFCGMDVAAQPIFAGQAMIDALGLKNISLRQLDIMEAGPELGEFDFIISHGVYTWIPAEVQDRLLAICREHLAANGVAYVSYDVYPGAHLGKLTREMMLYHVRGLNDPAQKIQQARALIRFLSEARDEGEFYSVFLKDEVERVAEWSDWSIFHDNLAPVYSACYFHEFVEHAARHGLAFLAEADFYQMHPQTSNVKARERLRQLEGDEIAREQYLDFLSCRHFRRTLLCHEGTKITRDLRPESLRAFLVASPSRPVEPEPEIRSAKVEEFRSSKGASISIGHPLGKAALTILCQTWPKAVAFDELVDRARALAAEGGVSREKSADSATRADDAYMLGDLVLRTYAANLTELHVYAPRLVVEPSERPLASAVARFEIERGDKVTNLLHGTVRVEDPLCVKLLRLLDGTRDRTTLQRELGSEAEAGLERNLVALAQMALLER
jgi:methyltransferase-like protein/trans-aconitate methyltransferase